MQKQPDRERELEAQLHETQAQVAALREALEGEAEQHHMHTPEEPCLTCEALTNTAATAREYEERIRDDENEACAKILEANAWKMTTRQEDARQIRARRRAGEVEP